jgi:hypothetical protein
MAGGGERTAPPADRSRRALRVLFPDTHYPLSTRPAMFNLLLADGSRFWNNDLWYAVPAVVAISLVYAATRHEKMQPILAYAGRWALWILGFMFVVFAVLEAIDWLV